MRPTLALLTLAMLAGCGGGSDAWEAPEVAPCKAALVAAGVAASSLEYPASTVAKNVSADGAVVVDFPTGYAPGQAGYRFFGACTLSGGAVVSLRLPGG